MEWIDIKSGELPKEGQILALIKFTNGYQDYFVCDVSFINGILFIKFMYQGICYSGGFEELYKSSRVSIFQGYKFLFWQPITPPVNKEKECQNKR